MPTAPLRSAALALALLLLAAASAAPAQLTLLHANDAESSLFARDGAGGAAGFSAVLAKARTAAVLAGRHVLTLSAGDNVLAGAVFNDGRERGVFHDAKVMAALGYDAVAIGNHEFDSGPDALAGLIRDYRAHGGGATFLGANLDVGGAPGLAALREEGVLARRVVVTRGGVRYGIVGAVTERLGVVSSPGAVEVEPVAQAVLREVAALEAEGVRRIVLVGHLQSVRNDLALVGGLRGVDVVVAGGGEELLVNEDNALDRVERRHGPYPLVATDADGNAVPVVTTTGHYRYVGRLDVDFDDEGRVVAFGGEPLPVTAGTVAAAGGEDAWLARAVLEPLARRLGPASQRIVADTAVPLDGRRHHVRTRETNLGSLVADSFAWLAERQGAGTGAAPVIAIANGGGIRNDDVHPPGPVSALDVERWLPFDNRLVVVSGVSADRLAALLEHAVAAVEHANGRFAQVSGLRFFYDPTGEPGVGRLVAVSLLDGTPVWDRERGARHAGRFAVVTTDFIAEGGDGYDFGGLERVDLDVEPGAALVRYLSEAEGLAGRVTAAAYPPGGLGRIGPLTTRSMAGGGVGRNALR